MRAIILAVILSLLVVACSVAAGDEQPLIATPARPAATATAILQVKATPIPPINVDDMMGMYPQQTVYVATTDHVSAITLLNHFIRYRIVTNGVAEVSVDRGGRWLYLLDADTAGRRRLRRFDVQIGAEHAVAGGLTDVVEGGHALRVAGDGRVLVLRSDASRAWVEAYQDSTLRSLGEVVQGPSCSDRLLTSATRIAVLCSSTGQLSLNNLGRAQDQQENVEPGFLPVVAAAIADDGTVYLASADEHLASVEANTSNLLEMAWPGDWSGTVLTDGLAVDQAGTALLIAETNNDGPWLRVWPRTAGIQRKSLRLDGDPGGTVLALWPFAYYASGSTIRHVDLTTGLLETMAEVGPGAVAGAVVNG